MDSSPNTIEVDAILMVKGFDFWCSTNAPWKLFDVLPLIITIPPLRKKSHTRQPGAQNPQPGPLPTGPVLKPHEAQQKTVCDYDNLSVQIEQCRRRQQRQQRV